jgi:hypothetical protein
MKKVTLILSGIILMTIATVSVNAQNTDTETAQASATILQHLSLTKNVDLAFGGIITDTDGGSVLIPATAAGTPSYTGLPTQLAATTSAAQFTANGEDDATFAITLPASTIITDGTHNMTIDNFVSSVGTSGVQLVSSEKMFYVGATLNIDAAQAAGLYTGSFNVTVTYE